MADAWTINAGGRVYGPYPFERMQAFAEEGRLAAHSLVAREDASNWREAQDDPAFGKFFGNVAAAAPELETAPAPAAELPVNEPAHLTIAADVKPQAKRKLEQAISSLGPAFKVLPNVWILSCDQPANAVRNRLVQELGKRDSLFVVDSTHGKAAWFNFGAKADSSIRRVWQRAI